MKERAQRLGNVAGHVGMFGIIMNQLTDGNVLAYVLSAIAIIIGFSVYVFSGD
jgi:hypothetical protein